MTDVERSVREDVIRKLAAIRASYAPKLGEMIGSVRTLWSQLGAPSLDAADRTRICKDLIDVVHRMGGTGGTVGYPGISQAAAPLEILLRAVAARDVLVNPVYAAQVQFHIDTLAEEFARGETEPVDFGQAPAERPAPKQAKLVYLFDDEPQAGTALAVQLESLGYGIDVFTEPDQLLAAIANQPPAAAVLDLMAPGRGMVGIELAGRIAGACPVVVLTVRDDMAARLAAVRAGCAAYLVKPAAPEELVEWLDGLTEAVDGDPLRVLIIDDDHSLAKSYAIILDLAGITPTILKDPGELLEVMADVRPDLILMDLYMGEWSGIELAAIIRQQRAYLGIPIVFLSVESDIQCQLSASIKGGDDFLNKPIRPGHLVSAVRARAQRARKMRAGMERDSLTGLLNHSRLKEGLRKEVARAQRQRTPLGVALIDIDHFKQVNDRYGHQVGDRVLMTLARLLKRRLRLPDTIGRYGGEEFAVVLPDTDRIKAAAVLNEIREGFARVSHAGAGGVFSVTLSAGVADLTCAGDTETLIAQADMALYAAKRAGRNRIEVACGALGEASSFR